MRSISIWNLEMQVSKEREMLEYSEINFSEQRKGPTTQPPYGVDAGICAPATLVGGGCSHY